MKMPTTLQGRLYAIAALILLIGTSASILIYCTVDDLDTQNVLGDQLDESKSYRRSLELYGGKANLLASQFMQWFNGLWHGRSLAITIACITGFLCLVIFLFAYNTPSDVE